MLLREEKIESTTKLFNRSQLLTKYLPDLFIFYDDKILIIIHWTLGKKYKKLSKLKIEKSNKMMRRSKKNETDIIKMIDDNNIYRLFEK